jgi:isochorismate synthase EntC
MRNLLLFAFCISVLTNLNAQVPTAMPPDANAFYINAMPAIRQQVKDIVLKTANAIKHRDPNADSLSQKLRTNNTLKGMSNNDIDGITVLIMVQASRDADADLKLVVLEMNRRNEQKQQQQITMQTVSVNNIENKNRSIEEINETQNLKLRMIMERKSRIPEEISNMMKKISGTQQNIISNLK